ncbi:MAG: PD40 domain-containing protein, partial [Methanomicrobia archaeon]|nr:PD40 domain-containing protein [Methanomicrobia archaeon]
MYTIKLAGRFIAFMLIISMIGCVYPAVNVVRSRQIVSVIEKNKQSQLSVVTLEHIATIEITEKSENVSSVTRITDNVNEGEISSPAISPDGKEIAFQYWQLGEQSCNIWAVPTGGGTATRRITDSDNYNLSPTWSPDG